MPKFLIYYSIFIDCPYLYTILQKKNQAFAYFSVVMTGRREMNNDANIL